MIEGGVVRWSVAQIWSKRGPRLVKEFKGAGRGTFTPTYVRCWFSGGKLSVQPESPLFPGYLIYQAGEDPVGEIEGIIRVLPDCVRPAEMARMVVDDYMRVHDQDIPGEEPPPPPPEFSRRRPRRSKRARVGKKWRMLAKQRAEANP